MPRTHCNGPLSCCSCSGCVATIKSPPACPPHATAPLKSPLPPTPSSSRRCLLHSDCLALQRRQQRSEHVRRRHTFIAWSMGHAKKPQPPYQARACLTAWACFAEPAQILFASCCGSSMTPGARCTAPPGCRSDGSKLTLSKAALRILQHRSNSQQQAPCGCETSVGLPHTDGCQLVACCPQNTLCLLLP